MKRAVIYLRVSSSGQLTGEDEEGLSIPAQRDYCHGKAQDLGAEVVEEYVDKAESARSADRPALQAMLARIAKQKDVDYLIVHKVDRLARSLDDAIDIRARLAVNKVTLVSVAEHIDETPSGRLMHGMLATFAEFYSANLAQEVSKGMNKKFQNGGWPQRAPIGYLNERTTVEGRSVSKIVIDEMRADHIRWAFVSYSTGEWTLRSLIEALEDRGLTTRPTKKRAEGPVKLSHIQRILTNPFYMGVMTYNGEQRVGTHEPLIDAETYEKVQAILNSRDRSGERQRKHKHYLKGTVWCGYCHSRMTVYYPRSRSGRNYGYFMCLGQQRGEKCEQRNVPLESVEVAVERYVLTQKPADKELETCRRAVKRYLDAMDQISSKEVERQQTRLSKLANERRKLLQLHYDDHIPAELFKEEQARISQAEYAAKGIIDTFELRADDLRDFAEQAYDLFKQGPEAYRTGGPEIRRAINQALFERIWIIENGIVLDHRRSEMYADMVDDTLEQRLDNEINQLNDQKETKNLADGEADDDLAVPACTGSGSSKSYLVDRTGLEPPPRL